MKDYKKIVSKILKETANLKESYIPYGNIKERMHPALETALKERKHSLGTHPIFPDSDETHFESKLVAKRFNDVVNNYKRQFDTEQIDQSHIMGTFNLVNEIVGIEKTHKKELEELAKKMIIEEYQLEDDDLELIAELTTDISLDGTMKNPSPVIIEDMEFDNHDSIVNANDEVYKRRFINSMIQGAAKKGHHMYYLADKELMNLDPRLPNKYAKLMALADLAYFMFNENEMNGGQMKAGGVVKVEWPDNKKVKKPIIKAQATTFPVLVHELIKGVMEVLSSHGLPTDDKLREYVIGKADFLNAEPWDMRIGPAIWERFTEMIEPEDFNLKHHIYAEMCSLPVREFNKQMKEIMAGTKAGKNYIKEIVENIKNEMSLDEYEDAMKQIDSNDDYMNLDDLNALNPEDI